MSWFAEIGADSNFPYELLMVGLEKSKEFTNLKSTINSDYIFFRELYNCTAKRNINSNIILRLFKDYIIYLNTRIGIEGFDEKKDVSGLRSYKIIPGKIRKFMESNETISQNVRVTIISETFLKTRNNLPGNMLQYMTYAIYGSQNIIEKLIKEQITKFRIARFETKKEGINPGTIAISENSKKFFVKTHKNYPFGGRSFGSKGFTTLDRSKSDSFTMPQSFAREIKYIDFKELFAYKVLEGLGFGPKTGFIINKPLHSGLYIFTDEICKFMPIKNLINLQETSEPDEGINKSFSMLRKGFLEEKFNPRDIGFSSFILNLTAFDIIARSMLLSDLNVSNFGLYDPKGYKIKKEYSRLASLKPCLVDFLPPNKEKIRKLNNDYLDESSLDIFLNKNEFVYVGINNSFLLANTFTNYPDLIFDDFFIPKRTTFFVNGITREIFNDRKKIYGSMAFSGILPKIEKIEGVLNSSYKEILDLFFSNYDKNNQEQQVFELPNQFKQLEELRQYKKAISIHLKTIFNYVVPDEQKIQIVDDNYFERDEIEKTELQNLLKGTTL